MTEMMGLLLKRSVIDKASEKMQDPGTGLIVLEVVMLLGFLVMLMGRWRGAQWAEGQKSPGRFLLLMLVLGGSAIAPLLYAMGIGSLPPSLCLVLLGALLVVFVGFGLQYLHERRQRPQSCRGSSHTAFEAITCLKHFLINIPL